MHRYWQCLPEIRPAPAPAPLASTGRRLQAAGIPARAPEPSIIGPSPGPQPAAKTVLPGSRAPIYDLCGGAGLTCPLANKTLCKDSQYLDCVPNTHCVRLSQWYVHLPILELQRRYSFQYCSFQFCRTKSHCTARNFNLCVKLPYQ